MFSQPLFHFEVLHSKGLEEFSFEAKHFSLVIDLIGALLSYCFLVHVFSTFVGDMLKIVINRMCDICFFPWICPLLLSGKYNQTKWLRTRRP